MSETRYVFVEGVKVALTKEQIDYVKIELEKQKKDLNSYKKLLVHYGFSKVSGANAYQHEQHGWYAEIIKHNPNWIDVWLVGKFLPNTGFPGGKVYGTIDELKSEIDKALSNPELWEVDNED